MNRDQFIEINKWTREKTIPRSATELVERLIKIVKDIAYTITVNDRDRTRKAYAEAFITLYGSAAAQGYTYEEIVGFIAEKHRLNAEEVFKNEMKIKTVHENSH